MSDKTIIEINGVKLEVDLRQAKKIEDFKIGDNVKILIKEYSDSYKSHPGVIVGFDNFERLPTIVICYCDVSYSKAEIKFVYLNAQSKDVEICHMASHEKATDYLDREIASKEKDLIDLKHKKEYFITHYERSFEKE